MALAVEEAGGKVAGLYDILLRAYRIEAVRILEGGLPKWIKEGRPLEAGDVHPRPRPFTSRLADGFVASLDEVRAALASGSAQVVNARAADRFHGRVAEPRPALRCGHMPGSLNLPFADIVEHGALKRPRRSRPSSPPTGSTFKKPIITTCGSGVTAAIVALAVEEAGGKVAGLYDGSWAEWGARADCPVATGPM